MNDMSEFYKMKWPKKYAEIVGEDISAIKGIPHKEYSPFDKDPRDKKFIEPYLKFVAVNEDKPEDILRFINTYGLLGISSTDTESIKDISREIFRMREVMALKEALNLSELENMKLSIIKLCAILDAEKNLIDHWLGETIENENELQTLKIKAAVTIAKTVDKYIQHARPALYINPKEVMIGDRFFEPVWECKNLLIAMWVMLYADLTCGKVIRKCKNQGCSEWFTVYGKDLRKIYCDTKCAGTQAQREYRKRNPKPKRKKEAE